MQHSLDIALVIPAAENTYGLIQKAHVAEFNLGVGYIASYLQQHGFSVRVEDMTVARETSAEIIHRLTALSPRVLGFSIVTPLYCTAKKMVHQLRSLLKNTLFICGGAHATACHEDCLRDAGFDLVVVGEGEGTCQKILDTLKAQGDFKQVPGIAFLDNGQLVTTGPAERMDLDRLPFPLRDRATAGLFKNQIYFSDLSATNYNLLATRGCPYKCTFCGSSIIFPGPVRCRSADNVFQEIQYAFSELGIRHFFFEDSTFVFMEDLVRDICRKIIAARLPIEWGAMGRLNHVNPDLYQLMKKAGCTFLFFGVESGDNDILKTIRKNFTIEQAFENVEMVRRTGITFNCSFILGLPGETPETLEKSIQTALRMDPDYISFSLATPYPGTELWEQCLADGWTPPPWEDYELSRYTKPVYVPSGLTEEALIRAFREAYRRFYFRIPYVLRHLSKIHNFPTLKKHFRAACSLLTNKS